MNFNHLKFRNEWNFSWNILTSEALQHNDHIILPSHGLSPSMHCIGPSCSVAPPLSHMTSGCSQEQTVQLKIKRLLVCVCGWVGVVLCELSITHRSRRPAHLLLHQSSEHRKQLPGATGDNMLLEPLLNRWMREINKCEQTLFHLKFWRRWPPPTSGCLCVSVTAVSIPGSAVQRVQFLLLFQQSGTNQIQHFAQHRTQGS